MKNSLTMKMNLFLSLFFLSVISPLFFGNSDANALITCVVRSGQSAPTDGCKVKTATGVVNTTVCNDADKCEAADVSSKNSFSQTLCNALNIITGTGGKAFAAFAIISLGIGFFTGKVSWGLMVGVTAGIAAMFGAPTIVSAIGGGSTIDCKASGGALVD